MQKLIPLNKIKPNPFRSLGDYPLHEDKLNELAESIEETGFWENILARENNGAVELAYGHHRLEVLRRKYRKSPETKIPLSIADLSNEDMLKIMVRENREEFGGSATQNMMDVEVAVKAFANGAVAFPKVPDKARKSDCRVAPSFVKTPDDTTECRIIYTPATLGEAIGATHDKGQARPWVRNALDALAAAEAKLIEKEWVEGLPQENAKVVAEGAGTIKRSYDQAAAYAQKRGRSDEAEKLRRDGTAKARQEAKAAAARMKHPTNPAGIREVREAMSAAKHRGKKKPQLPNVEKYVSVLTKHIDAFLAKDQKLTVRINQLLPHISSMEPADRRHIAKLTGSLSKLADRCQACISRLDKSPKLLT